MTQDELDALPEDGGITYTDEIRDGKTVRIPHMQPVHALYAGDNDMLMVIDRQGQAWTTGWAGGRLYKRRMR